MITMSKVLKLQKEEVPYNRICQMIIWKCKQILEITNQAFPITSTIKCLREDLNIEILKAIIKSLLSWTFKVLISLFKMLILIFSSVNPYLLKKITKIVQFKRKKKRKWALFLNLKNKKLKPKDRYYYKSILKKKDSIWQKKIKIIEKS